jgi:SAM-dependent methyltransferase
MRIGMQMARGMDLEAVRRAFSGSSMFLVEDWSVDVDRLEVTGWCVSEYEGGVGFYLGKGRPRVERLGLPSPSLSKVLPFFRGSGNAAFRIECVLGSEDLARGYMDVAFCDRVLGEALNPWHTTRIPFNSGRFPTPLPEQLQRTQGNTSLARYLAYGLTVVMRMEWILDRYFDRSIEDIGTVLDWGVGCGRIARHISNRCSEFIGLDIDQENVAWCGDNLPGRYETCDLMPPTLLRSDSVDLAYGISVFTHLTHEAAVAWRDELTRVLRPGGICIVTVHGVTGLGRVLDDERLLGIAAMGYDASAEDRRLDRVLVDRGYYRATYQTPADVRAFFGEKFKVVDKLRGANALLQDIVVLKKRV